MSDSRTDFLLDKHGREIQVGDVLKVFHFVAAVRREKCYMYKQVIERVEDRLPPYLRISHLNLVSGTDGEYWQVLDGRQMNHWEIVQGTDEWFRDRPKRKSVESHE